MSGSLTCTNGGVHEHALIEEVLACYGLIPQSKLRNPHAGAAGPVALATDKQVDYVAKLGGDAVAARTMTLKECSDYIGRLIAAPPTTVATPAAPKADAEPDPWLIDYEMLNLLSWGYYAVREDSLSPYRFYYVSRPTHGQYKDAVKVQMQHGSGYGEGRWTPAYVAWPSKHVSVYDRRQKDHVMIMIATQNEAMRAYSQEIGRCCRCNAVLTDERSRYYGIGPECEKSNLGIIEDINLSKGEYKAGS
jgi:hypothetical protein